METQHQIIVKLARRRWISPMEALNAGGGMNRKTSPKKLNEHLTF